MILEVSDAVVAYGSAVAVDRVSFSVEAGGMVALVGPNGAGKTSLVNAISGLVPLRSGAITRGGRVAQVPEGRQMFGELTVEDNIRLGGWKSGERDPEPMYELFPDLRERRSQQSATLSGGQQQMVSIARALMAKPELLVIDELSLGLAPLIVEDLARHLSVINESQGTAILLIEQEVGLALRLCERALVMEAGRIVLDGTTAELTESDELSALYLGGTTDEGKAGE
ncbi:MAG: ABC transporter ATP-binding protein [Leucobacter sp.]